MESGSFHISIQEWGLEIRGIRYCTSKGKVWIYMPSKKGEVEGKQCEFPIFNFIDKIYQRKFVKKLQKIFLEFMKTEKYKPYSFGSKPSVKMIFRDLKPLGCKK